MNLYVRNVPKLRVQMNDVVRYGLSILLLMHNALSAQDTKPNAKLPSVWIAESLIGLSLSPPVDDAKCILVMPDGKFHMEWRHQVLPAPKSDVKIYEGVLNSSQRQLLQSVISDHALKEFPDSKVPAVPTGSGFVRAGGTKIQRDNYFQQVEYADWGSVRKSYQGVSAEVAERQRQGEIVLQPLMDWFHQLQNSDLKEVDVAPNLCGHGDK
jgi:hypothetical protein